MDGNDSTRLFPDLGASPLLSQEIRVRFVNRCCFPIDVFWLSQEREPTKYATLKEKQYLDVRTYKNHPWVARRAVDGCKLQMNTNPIYWPEPTAHANLIVRSYCNITLKIQSLREIACHTLLHETPSEIKEQLLNLPRELQDEVNKAIDTKKEYCEVVCRFPTVRANPPREEPV
ncbi:hypothetical protein GCK72_023767 [Caenorhabditis remanei]|uniref:von Hippel-Lindau disease tumour suppressor beta domain-containing protein n=1 Tax=Caenorhabditis remanei TaxID=31234 RepID=A0A6A5FXQ3_CAERE|nr:hypothetical protein GCK72_023767 [Caenorhabditis remanei]KAF1747305.1 hypothetical protein GCK72_023767 [Caenorhabditis remanei]